MPSGSIQLWERGYRLCGRFGHRRTVRIRVPLIHSPVRTEISSGACSRSFTNSSVSRRRVICNGGLESYRQDFVMFICERDEADLHLRNRSHKLQCLIPEFLSVGTAKCGCDGELLSTYLLVQHSRHTAHQAEAPCIREPAIICIAQRLLWR